MFKSTEKSVLETTQGWTKDALRRAYRQYVEAMCRKRAGSQLSKEAFWGYLSQPSVRVFRYNGSYIFGQLGGGIFKVSHFAPATMRGGVDAVQALLSTDQACVLAVPKDMALMLERLGHEDQGTVQMDFRGESMDKHLFSNNRPLAMELRVKSYAVRTGEATLEQFHRLLDVASLCWAEARYGWVEHMECV